MPAGDDRSDEELVEAVNDGDTDAFAVLYTRYKQWTVDLAYRHTRDPELSLEIMQEAFIALLRTFPGFVLRGRMTTYLYPVVRHLSISMQQRARRTQTLASLPDQPTTGTADPDRLELLRQAVDDLPIGQREVLLLRVVDGHSLAVIAETLGIPEGTVKSRLHHALQALREHPTTKNYFLE